MCAPLGILLREQRRHRQFLPAWLPDVAREVRVGQFLGFDHGVERLRRAEAKVFLSQREILQNVQHLQRGNSLPVRRQLVHGPVVVGRREGLDPFGGKFGKVLRGHRPVMAFHGLEDFLRDFALVECVAAVLRDLPQRPRQIHIAKNFADLRSVILDQVRARRSLIVAQQVRVRRPDRGDPFRHRKTFLGRADGRREHLGKFLPPELVGQFLPAVHRPRHGDAVHAALRHGAQPLPVQKVNGQLAGRPTARV